MEVSYDFHIHTAASPCAEDEMTPENIINLAHLLGKQIIAITDHNTCVNCEVAMAIGKSKGIVVVPGMEIECMEECHLIALFPHIQGAYAIQKCVWEHLPDLPNRKDIFGNQWIFNDKGEVVGEIERLLLTATQISLEEITKQVSVVGGVVIPAHIDRSSYSILSNLGAIPEELDFKALELSTQADGAWYQQLYPKYKLLVGSDAHRLETMCSHEMFLELERLSISGLIDSLWKSL